METKSPKRTVNKVDAETEEMMASFKAEAQDIVDEKCQALSNIDKVRLGYVVFVAGLTVGVAGVQSQDARPDEQDDEEYGRWRYVISVVIFADMCSDG